MKNTQKKSYQAPDLKKIGSFESVTQQTNRGRKLDAAFDSGIDLEDVTTMS